MTIFTHIKGEGIGADASYISDIDIRLIYIILFGSDRSPRRGDLVCLSVRPCVTFLKRTWKRSPRELKKGPDASKQASKQAGKQVKQAGTQASKLASR